MVLDGLDSGHARVRSRRARLVRVRHTSDCAFIGHSGAQLSGSGVAIGIQSKGTTVIHQRDLLPLDQSRAVPPSP